MNSRGCDYKHLACVGPSHTVSQSWDGKNYSQFFQELSKNYLQSTTACKQRISFSKSVCAYKPHLRAGTMASSRQPTQNVLKGIVSYIYIFKSHMALFVYFPITSLLLVYYSLQFCFYRFCLCVALPMYVLSLVAFSFAVFQFVFSVLFLSFPFACLLKRGTGSVELQR